MTQNNDKNNKNFLSTAELAKLLGVSRVAVLKKIQRGVIKAQKVGRNYIISTSELAALSGEFISPEKKAEIEHIVKEAVDQYAETLRLLGKE